MFSHSLAINAGNASSVILLAWICARWALPQCSDTGHGIHALVPIYSPITTWENRTEQRLYSLGSLY